MYDLWKRSRGGSWSKVGEAVTRGEARRLARRTGPGMYRIGEAGGGYRQWRVEVLPNGVSRKLPPLGLYGSPALLLN